MLSDPILQWFALRRGKGETMPIPPSTDIHAYDDSPWWAIYTRHQHEKTVADMLSTKGFDVFLPLYDSVRRWKDRKKVLSLPLFPCYVFVRGTMTRKLQVVSTPGVHMILYHGEQVAMIPEPEIQAIRAAVDGHFRVEPHPFLKCGDRVRVIRGSLDGVEGILTRKKNSLRLILSVDMLAQSVAVEVNAADVEPIMAAQPAEIAGDAQAGADLTLQQPFARIVRPDLGLVNG
jgi:transcription antitermination factor NusG